MTVLVWVFPEVTEIRTQVRAYVGGDLREYCRKGVREQGREGKTDKDHSAKEGVILVNCSLIPLWNSGKWCGMPVSEFCH